MLEIIHDLAPALNSSLPTADGRPASMAQKYPQPAHQRCDIIIDDITYDDEPPFQDG